jgi:hypothetical protein
MLLLEIEREGSAGIEDSMFKGVPFGEFLEVRTDRPK